MPSGINNETERSKRTTAEPNHLPVPVGGVVPPVGLLVIVGLVGVGAAAAAAHHMGAHLVAQVGARVGPRHAAQRVDPRVRAAVHAHGGGGSGVAAAGAGAGAGVLLPGAARAAELRAGVQAVAPRPARRREQRGVAQPGRALPGRGGAAHRHPLQRAHLQGQGEPGAAPRGGDASRGLTPLGSPP